MKIGIIPTIKQEAITFHNAYLSDEEESKVKIEIPDKTPTPANPIIRRTNHHGTPLFLRGERLRKAWTMFRRLVHKAVTHKVDIAMMKPIDIPISTLSNVKE